MSRGIAERSGHIGSSDLTPGPALIADSNGRDSTRSLEECCRINIRTTVRLEAAQGQTCPSGKHILRRQKKSPICIIDNYDAIRLDFLKSSTGAVNSAETVDDNDVESIVGELIDG